MNRINLQLSKKKWILIISCIICVVAAVALHIVSARMKGQLPHEQVATTWDEENNTAHVSVFFSESEKYSWKQQDPVETQYKIESWYHNLEEKITEASVKTAGVTNSNARSVVYGYHATGKVTLENNKSKVEVSAYGVGGDFFLFHPIKLLYGSYFSQSDLMQDRIVIDTETAWQLFGSNDVVGMFVTIGEIPHMIVGVYERERSALSDAAGNAVSSVYVSHATLQNYGTYHGMENIEYLLPNPVTGFGKGLIEEQCQNMDVMFVEHQNRFTPRSLWNVIKQFGTRSMVLNGITFPYWENMARAYEDSLSVLLMLEFVLWLYVGIVAITFVWYSWLHRKWRAKHLYEKAKDYSYALSVNYHKKKQNKHIKGEEEL